MNYEKSPNTEADVAVLKSWIDRYCAIVNAGDFDAYRTLWTEDVVYLPPNGPACQGIEDCVDVNRFYFEQYTSVEKHYVEEIEVAGTFAYVRVRYTYHGVPKGEGEPRVEDGKAIFMLKRQPDGSWLATHLMWNSNIPPE
jgi:ketosteroid isomerase-like protein